MRSWWKWTRQRAFAPLKNAPGAKADTPESVRRQMAALRRDWLRQAGAEVDDEIVVEISPLVCAGCRGVGGEDSRPERGSRRQRTSKCRVRETHKPQLLVVRFTHLTSDFRRLRPLLSGRALPSASCRASPPASLRPWPRRGRDRRARPSSGLAPWPLPWASPSS